MKVVLLSILLTLTTTGCMTQAVDTLRYDLGSQDGHPAMRLGELTLVFEAKKTQGEPNNLRKTTGLLQVGGRGISTRGASVDNASFTSLYRDGVATVTVGEQSFRILDKGLRVDLGGKPVAVTGEKKTIRFGVGGAVKIDE